jgi:transcriptional regulator with XRE-family HTH domain
VSPPYISNIEHGKQAMSITILSGLSDVLEVSADWLLKDKPNETAEITIEKITEVLIDCSPEEKDAIMKIVKEVKTTLRSIMPTPIE